MPAFLSQYASTYTVDRHGKGHKKESHPPIANSIFSASLNGPTLGLFVKREMEMSNVVELRKRAKPGVRKRKSIKVQMHDEQIAEVDALAAQYQCSRSQAFGLLLAFHREKNRQQLATG